MFSHLQTAIKQPGKADQLAIWKIKEAVLWNYLYDDLREPKVKGDIPDDPHMQAEVIQNLKKSGFKVVCFRINVSGYRQYLSKAQYHKYPNYYLGGKAPNFPEKSLEHYLAAKLLSLSSKDVYLDIGNLNSPTTEIYHKLYGCKAYRQDLVFPAGWHKDTMGGDAGDMPIPDGFATKMALHCSFEHFEQDSDIQFIKEASRVLSRKGKLCILPFYFFNKYAIRTDPSALPLRGIPFEKDASLYCVKGWRNRHARIYDIPHFIDRIGQNLNDLRLTFYHVLNEKEVAPSCYVKVMALFEKP